MKVGIIGLGRVGLPLALVFASRGIQVIGMDIENDRIKMLQQGKMPFIENDAEEILRAVIGKALNVATSNKEVMNTDTVILTLGTPVDDFMNPDYSQIEKALSDMTPYLKREQLIILRSTVSPGTTEYVKDYIEKRTNFKVGKNLFLAYCPERLAEGNAIKELFELPEIIGALDKKSASKAEGLFKNIKNEIYKTSATNAELLKLFTNMYRYINFAIANEFMIIAEQFGGNIYEIVGLASKNYPRGGPARPGFTAGPCLFKDGFFLANKIPFPELICSAWKINETIPYYLIEKVKEFKSLKDAEVGVLGLSFKADMDDTRASLSFKLVKILKREGAQVRIHDIYVKNGDLEGFLKGLDVLIVATAHKQYRDLPLSHYQRFVEQDCVVVDIWSIFGKSKIIWKINSDA